MTIGILALCLLLAPAARGQETPGNEFRGWIVQTLHVRGVDESLAASLKSGLALSERRAIYKTRRVAFYPALLQEDLRRARLFLARHGFPYATVEPVFQPIERGQSLRVVLAVTPGPRVAITGVTTRGVPDDLSYRSPLTTATRFSDAALGSAVDHLLAALRSAGYARASVGSAVEWSDSTHVSVTLNAEPGSVYHFADVRVTGTEPDLAQLVRKSAGISPGQRYTPAAVDGVRTNLRALDLFRQVRVSTVEAGGEDLDVKADLMARRPRTIEAGVGYWSDDLLRGRFRWEHRNLFKGGRGVDFEVGASKFLQSARVSTWWPAVVGARTRASLSVSGERQDEDSYELLRVGGGVGLTYRFSLRASARWGVNVNQVDVERTTRDPTAFVEEGGLLTIFSFRISRNSANDRVYPDGGTVVWLNAEMAPPGPLSGTHFYLLEASFTRYRGLAERIVLASRINVGVARPLGGSVDLLPDKRFYAGGSTSMRGFRRHKLGPLDSEGSALGGELKAVGGVELRFPLVWRFDAAAFLDVGQVWRRRSDVDAEDVEVAVGPGIMVRTPVGPIRADWGFRVTDEVPDQPGSAFHIAIGNPF